jgi:tripartite-type tricarboxylate transporter receptor subunit TctC
VARILAPWLSERLGQQVIVENKPGAGTNLAAQSVINAPPDGHTLLFVTPVNAINATLYGGLSFSFIRDIAPVAGIVTVPFVLVVNPAVPAKTVAELIAYAKANPGKISMGSAGVGSVPHMAGELFKLMAGIDMVHVPYRGNAPALTDLLAGQVQVMFGGATSSIDYIRTGKLRGLAVTTATRSEALPDLPTVDTFLPGFEASTWLGIGAPRNTSAEIVDKLNNEVNGALADPKIKARLADLAGAVLPGLPADFANLVASETEKWAKVVKFAGIKAN